MNLRMVIVACLASALFGAPAVAQEGQFSMDYWGFTSIEGGVLTGMGFIPVIEPPLIFDLENCQYTWVIEGAVLQDYSVEEGIEHYSFSGGTFKVYEDCAVPWNAWYSDLNCHGPSWIGEISGASTFQDGQLFLSGDFDYIMINYYTAYEFGDYDGLMDLTGGSHLGDIPELLRHGWTFGGETDQPWACVPVGFDYRWDGQLFLVQNPTGNETATWSGVKAMYR
jgi:hypothetical protein